MARLAGAVLLGLGLLAMRVEAAEARAAFAAKVCGEAVRNAGRVGIDANFFIRLLWKESLFDPNAVSPKGAQGLAQFMPETAAKRGLSDPFDPVAAVAASADYLSELKKTFGNMGMAAAAYNAGEERVQRYVDGKTGLPDETEDYVAFITGQAADAWQDPSASHAIPSAGPAKDPIADCVQLALRTAAPKGSGMRLAARKPWGALLASNFNQGKALAMYRRLRLRAPAVLANTDPMVVRKRNLSRGSRAMNMVMLGADSREAAAAICQKLQPSGVPCVVMKSR
ncbi:MAG: lytic transglycosylase domain-containing protein [Hyphomicrobiales bacterium]